MEEPRINKNGVLRVSIVELVNIPRLAENRRATRCLHEVAALSRRRRGRAGSIERYGAGVAAMAWRSTRR